MDTNELAAVLDEPEVHRNILKGYKGPYALGVAKPPDGEGEAALLLRIGNDAPSDISQEVEINGELVPVIIKRGFSPPRAL